MSLFIAGTGTGVGKTLVTAGLAALLQKKGESVCVYKPIQTGCPDVAHPEDLETVKSLVGADVPTFCSYCFAEPVAPYAADPHRTIHPRKLLHDFKDLQKQHRIILVEGVGGVRVPIARHFEMQDLIRMLQLPVVIVATPHLGTINHTLLTVDALLVQRLEIKGVIISGMPAADRQDAAMQSLIATLEPFLTIPILGSIPALEPKPGLFQQEHTLDAFEALSLFEA
jgi:dethiobiotin synthetase